MPSTRAWLALTAALALAAPLGALADPQRQRRGTEVEFTNFDILKQLVKDHHAQTGKTVQARRGAGVVSVSVASSTPTPRRRGLLAAPRPTALRRLPRAHNRPEPRPRARPRAPLLDQLAQLLDGNASAPITAKRVRDSGWTPCSSPPNLTALLAALSAPERPGLQPFSDRRSCRRDPSVSNSRRSSATSPTPPSSRRPDRDSTPSSPRRTGPTSSDPWRRRPRSGPLRASRNFRRDPSVINSRRSSATSPTPRSSPRAVRTPSAAVGCSTPRTGPNSPI